MPRNVRHGNRWCRGMIFASMNGQGCHDEKSRHDQIGVDFGFARHFVLLAGLLRTSVPNLKRCYGGSGMEVLTACKGIAKRCIAGCSVRFSSRALSQVTESRSEEHTSELQSHSDLVCRLLLEKKKNK